MANLWRIHKNPLREQVRYAILISNMKGRGDVNLLKIRYFVEVARCGSFSAAAAKLYTSQPNISKQIAQMEQELDYPLFVRDKRSIRLTTAGAFLYEHLKDMPERLETLFEQAAILSRKEESRLSIGILEGQDVRPQFLYRLELAKERYPHLEIELERNSFANLRNGLKAGHYDMIITLDFDVEQEPEFDSFVMFDQAPAIAINRKHPLSGMDELDMMQLRNEDFVVISPEESPVGYDRFIKQCQETGFTPRIVRQPRSLESLILCVEMGVGVALLDQHTRLTYNDAVRTIPIPGKDMYVVAACLKNDYRPMLQNVLKLLKGKHD